MRNRSYAILALAALAFAGCSKAEEFNCNPDSAHFYRKSSRNTTADV